MVVPSMEPVLLTSLRNWKDGTVELLPEVCVLNFHNKTSVSPTFVAFDADFVILWKGMVVLILNDPLLFQYL